MPQKSRFSDLDVMDYAYKILDRINATKGEAAATLAARAMVRTGADIEAGHAMVVKSSDGVQAVYKQAPDPVEQAIDRLRQAAQAAGQITADDEVVRQIDALAAALGRLTTPAGQRLEAKMKSSAPAWAICDDGRHIAAPIARKGTKR